VLFVTHPGERFYMQQLIRDLGASSSQLQKELAKLEGIGFLKSSRESNTRFYRVDKSFPLLPELKSMIYKTSGLADYLRAELEEIGNIEVALIYGSVAKNVEDMRSDVDVLVIGNVDLDSLHEAIGAAEKSIGREINPTVFTRKDWIARIKKEQAFAMDILDAPKIVLIGDENELRGTT
jgi:predicted nucleotidyltransferase